MIHRESNSFWCNQLKQTPRVYHNEPGTNQPVFGNDSHCHTIYPFGTLVPLAEIPFPSNHWNGNMNCYATGYHNLRQVVIPSHQNFDCFSGQSCLHTFHVTHPWQHEDQHMQGKSSKVSKRYVFSCNATQQQSLRKWLRTVGTIVSESINVEIRAPRCLADHVVHKSSLPFTSRGTVWYCKQIVHKATGNTLPAL